MLKSGPLPECPRSPVAQRPCERRSRARWAQPAGVWRPPERFVAQAPNFSTLLAAALEARGLVVWYDETELRVGDSLRRKIDAGISRSRFGLVVLSKTFFSKGWTSYELDGLVTRSVDGGQVLLPLWHGISKDEVIAASPSLADKVALRTSDYSVEEIAEELASVILGSGDEDRDDLAS